MSKLVALLLALLALSPSAALAQVAEGWDDPPPPPAAAEEEAPRGGPSLPPANAPQVFSNMEDLEKAGEGLKKTGSNVVQIIEKLISAQVFFPARTFQKAVENAATGILGDSVNDIVEQVTIGALEYLRASLDIAYSAEVKAMAQGVEIASVAILGIGLAIAVLSALAGEAAGVGGGPSSVGQAFARWMFVALATTNASSLILLAHSAFYELTVMAIGNGISPNTILNMLMPGTSTGLAFFVILLIVAVAVAVVIALATVARLAVVAILHVIGPLCIASASLPFGTPIFGQWLTMFVKAELLGVANGVLMVVGLALTAQVKNNPLMSPLFVLAIFGVMLALNLSMIKNVFGGVVAIAQMGLRATGAAVGLLAGGVGGLLAAKGTLAMAGVGSLASGIGGVGGSSSGGGSGTSGGSIGTGGTSGAGGTATASATSNTANTAAGLVGAVAAAYSSARAGWQSPVSTMLGAATAWAQPSSPAATAEEQRIENLTTEIAGRLGIKDAAGRNFITNAVRSGVEVGGGARISGEQLAQNVRQTAPVIDALVEQFGGRGQSVEVRREEAAAKLGFSSYAEMAVALSAYNPQGATPQEVVGPTMDAWMQAPPDKTSPLWGKDAPYDYAVGTFVSRVAGSSSTRAPLWAKTMGSLRRAFGEQYVADFVARAAQERWDERTMMREVDARVISAKQSVNEVEASMADKVVRFWRPGEAKGEARRR